ncbi:MAG: SDR family oxidoreductase [Alphaproteobacteria bacterium]|nr:SDR family oxidoreductase [Alphaproteobacteria bacterium]
MRTGERVKGKVALVTGAGSAGPGWGNGKASAVLYAREGARVMAVDRDPAAAEETRRLIEEAGGECAVVAADVSKGTEVERLVGACLDRFGRIDILHNNVGIVAIGGPVETSEEDWDRVVSVNQRSMFLTCKHVLPAMERQGAGAIVNISSVAAIRGAGVHYAAYAASKAAVLGLTRSVALQYAAKNIRANAILPGLMNTPMIREPLKAAYGGDEAKMIETRDRQCPMGHMGDAWDVAYAALFLASDEARYITGAELVVDGGLTLRSA